MHVQHEVTNVQRVNDNRVIFDATVEFSNGSVFEWKLARCSLVNVHGTWLVFGPSRYDHGAFTELTSIPFPVRQELRASVLEAIGETA